MPFQDLDFLSIPNILYSKIKHFFERFALIKVFEEMFLRSWWVILFMILCYMLFEHSVNQRDVEYSKLYQQLLELREARSIALAAQKRLMMQINSQSDPEWIELVLKKGLGLVPEGQIKVFFDKEPNES